MLGSGIWLFSVNWESFLVGVGFWYMAVSMNWKSFFVGVGFWYMAVFYKLGVLFCGCWDLVYG